MLEQTVMIDLYFDLSTILASSDIGIK
jgi:hypothetical protein